MKTFVIPGTFASRGVADWVYAPLADALDADIIPLKRLGLSHVDRSVEEVEKAVPPSFGDVTLVGHSQGGLVAALVAMRSFSIAKVVTIAAPLGGSRWAPTWAPFSSARCMAVNSRLCRNLRDDWATCHAEGLSPSMLNIVGKRDTLVAPEYAHLPGADTFVYDQGHLSLIWDDNVIDAIQAWLHTPTLKLAA